MRRIESLILIPLLAGCTTGRTITVDVVQDGVNIPVSEELRQRLEVHSTEVLASCTYQADSTIANLESWNRYQTQDYVRIGFRSSRRFDLVGQTFLVSEMVLPVTATRPPSYVFTRSDEGIHAFAKYSCLAGQALQEAVRVAALEVKGSNRELIQPDHRPN